MKPSMNFAVSVFFLELFTIATINISFCNGSSYVGCIQSERKALLRFKQDLDDPSSRLASWINSNRDCCTWVGVVCHNFTGHVIKLNLGNPVDLVSESVAEVEADTGSILGGKMNPSLLDLKHLNYLDLSGNDFQGIQIPKYLGSMENLRYLNLSEAGFAGMVPQQLGNLSALQYLDLESDGLQVQNLNWISGLSSLEHLDLTGLDLSMASDWLVAINSLSALRVLRLAGCQLHYFPPLSSANFSSLTTLDFSGNQFDNSVIPNWVFGLRNLVFLDLNFNHFQGSIPDGLGNLTSLRYLDLSANRFNSTIPIWFSRFEDLEYISLSANSLQGTISAGLGNWTSIKTIDFSINELEGKIPKSFERLCDLRSISLSFVKLSQEISEVLSIFSGCVAHKLELLDLSNCHFSGHLTNQLGRFKNLQTLRLTNNSLSGPIPSSLGELSSLKTLTLSNNKLEGSIPLSIGKLMSLEYLDFSSNKLEGSVPLSIGKLSSLESLHLSFNKLNGTLSEFHFINLTKLSTFHSSSNSLNMNVSPSWIPPFQLIALSLSSCNLGPLFPLWLQSQKQLAYLDISNTSISDFVPSWFWKSLSQFYSFNISHNQVQGMIPSLDGANILSLDLSSNNLSGPLPPLSLDASILDLSNNAFSGPIFHSLCHGKSIPKSTASLKLAGNLLSGDIPDCWTNWRNLIILNLANNRFTGQLPTSIGTIRFLQSLNLRNNRLSGSMPASLQNCKELVALDIGENEFAGNLPTWIGETFSELTVLNLRSNKFDGLLPIEFCRLTSLQTLDLACNNLSGTIPRCMNNLSAMVTSNYSGDTAISYSPNGFNIIEDAALVMKGKAVKYSTILNLVRTIDLSKNNFSGEIPIEVTDLGALLSLNLSHNHFTGEIPEKIGAMKSLESLDLSANNLSGKIPPSMSSLTFLAQLNLSTNNLIGKIPSSTQLQSLDASCFAGNDLCGLPLPKNCTENVSIPEGEHGGDEDEDGDGVDWFYVSMALGSVVGFWCFIGSLLVSRRWRYKYCHFLDRLGDKFGCLFARKCF